MSAGTKPVIQRSEPAPEFALVLDSLPQAVLVTGKDNHIHYANMAAEAVFQSSAAYMKRHNLSEFVPFGSPVLGLVEQVLPHGTPVNEYQIDISSPRSGVERIVDVHAAPLAGGSGRVVISFRERSMADRIDRQLSHRGAARSVTGLAAMLGHEIKNPLSGIRGAAQLLEDVVQGTDKQLASLITSETDRIVKIVDRMEIFSDERPLARKAVNIHAVLEHVKRLARNGFASALKISEQYDPSLPPVSGDRDQLVQVFLNLAKNAAEALHGQSAGEIVFSTAYRPGIRLATPGSHQPSALPLEISVSDNGPGIADDIRAHVFEPFVTTRINGSGLGLALVAKIIGQHGGTIECDTNPGGTIFRVLLPAFDRQAIGEPK